MRQAVNNLQSTFSGFNFVGADEVFKVCDQPHPVKVQGLITSCVKGDIDTAMDRLEELWKQGYSAVDIVTTLFRVTKSMDSLAEYTKLRFISVRQVTSRGITLTRRRRLDSRICACWRASARSCSSEGCSPACARSG